MGDQTEPQFHAKSFGNSRLSPDRSCPPVVALLLAVGVRQAVTRNTSLFEQATLHSRDMNAYKWADQYFLMHSYKDMFFRDSGVLPPDFPNTREIKIQIRKWEDMLEKTTMLMPVPGSTARRLRLTVLTKKELREEGRLTSQALQQGRKVFNLVLELLRQYMTEESARRGRKFSRQDFAGFRRKFEGEVLELRRDFVKTVGRSQVDLMKKNVLKGLASEIKQPKQSSKKALLNHSA